MIILLSKLNTGAMAGFSLVDEDALRSLTNGKKASATSVPRASKNHHLIECGFLIIGSLILATLP